MVFYNIKGCKAVDNQRNLPMNNPKFLIHDLNANSKFAKNVSKITKRSETKVVMNVQIGSKQHNIILCYLCGEGGAVKINDISIRY